GPALVLVHGLGGAASNLCELVPLLAPRFRLLVPDLPGHGGSSPLPSSPTLNPFADPVAAGAERERTWAAGVLGHATGRGTALHTDIGDAGRALIRDDPRTDLNRLRCPTLILWGARDHIVPLEDGIEYARRLRAPLRVIPDCGHLVIGERPDACADAITSFLT